MQLEVSTCDLEMCQGQLVASIATSPFPFPFPLVQGLYASNQLLERQSWFHAMQLDVACCTHLELLVLTLSRVPTFPSQPSTFVSHLEAHFSPTKRKKNSNLDVWKIYILINVQEKCASQNLRMHSTEIVKKGNKISNRFYVKYFQ